jgi:thioredoxin 1
MVHSAQKWEIEVMTVELNSQNYETVTSSEGIVLVDCWAPWCRNCDEFAEAFRRAAAKHPAHQFATLNTQEQRELRSVLSIKHVPSLMVYRDGVLLFQQPGNYDEAMLDKIVAQAEGLDMALLRAELASQKDDSAA